MHSRREWDALNYSHEYEDEDELELPAEQQQAKPVPPTRCLAGFAIEPRARD